MKNREILLSVIIIVLTGTLIVSNLQKPSKFDEKSFQKRIDSLSLIVKNNNKLRDSLQLDNSNRQEKIGELSNKLTKLNEKSKYKQLLAVKKNPFFNALQVKFSYSMTCHKSQGGQWKTVFIEQPYLPDGVSKEYYRWLYTALTRAQEKLYLIGFKDDFFID